jgi:hypothetical protein
MNEPSKGSIDMSFSGYDDELATGPYFMKLGTHQSKV